MTTSGACSEGIFPVVTTKVDGIECRALIDSGAGSSYGSAKPINLLKKRPTDVSKRRVDMLMSSQVSRLETYETVVESVSGDFQVDVNVIKVNKEELLSVDNPNYGRLLKEYPHVVLSSGEYARIKTNTKPRVGREGEPIAEKTKLGWFIMSPGSEFDHNKTLLTQTTRSNYDELCRLDILGLKDTTENSQVDVYLEFKEQLVRDEQGWYETGLPWKANHPPLPTNEKGSLCRLNSLIRTLEGRDSMRRMTISWKTS